LRGEKISKSLAQDAMRNIAGDEESDEITIQQIQKVVAGSFKISVGELLSKSKRSTSFSSASGCDVSL
jgi:chromosomal replication initiation ATPase DnaA